MRISHSTLHHTIDTGDGTHLGTMSWHDVPPDLWCSWLRHPHGFGWYWMLHNHLAMRMGWNDHSSHWSIWKSLISPNGRCPTKSSSWIEQRMWIWLAVPPTTIAGQWFWLRISATYAWISERCCLGRVSVRPFVEKTRWTYSLARDWDMRNMKLCRPFRALGLL